MSRLEWMAKDDLEESVAWRAGRGRGWGDDEDDWDEDEMDEEWEEEEDDEDEDDEDDEDDWDDDAYDDDEDDEDASLRHSRTTWH